MFTDVTHYSPYRPVAIGVRSKLVDIETGRIHWASDVVYDSSNAGVAEAARVYSKALGRDNFPVGGDGGAILMSPRLFCAICGSRKLPQSEAIIFECFC